MRDAGQPPRHLMSTGKVVLCGFLLLSEVKADEQNYDEIPEDDYIVG